MKLTSAPFTSADTQPVELVAREDFTPRLAALTGEGGRFVMLVGLDDRGLGRDGLAVEAVMALAGGRLTRVRAHLPVEDPTYESLTLRVAAAQWDEREAKDMLGIVARGHPDPRRLLLHEHWPAGFHPLRKDVPADARPGNAERHFVPFEVHGEGVYQLPVGPIHAGVIEPGHFRFSAIGEKVLYLDARLGFVHRGLEKLAEGRPLDGALWLIERACGVCALTHALAYSQAVEQLTRTEIPARARWARTLLAELERLYNHVGDLGNICAGIGFQSGVARLGYLKEQLLRANDALTGHRYLMGSVAPGGLTMDLDAEGLSHVNEALEEIGSQVPLAVRSVLRSEGVAARFHNTGVVSVELATALGAVGVAARASGLAIDLRHDAPYAAYDELAVPPVSAAAGDVMARFHVRAQEVHESLRLAREALRRLPPGLVRAPLREVPQQGVSVVSGVEGPRGSSWVWLRAGAEGTVDRLRLRSGSFANWPLVAAAVPGNLVPDFPLINKSFELCYACSDR